MKATETLVNQNSNFEELECEKFLSINQQKLKESSNGYGSSNGYCKT